MILRPFFTTITTSHNFCSHFIGILTTTVHLIEQLLHEILHDTFTNPSGIFFITDAELSALPLMSRSISSSWKEEQHTSAYRRIEDEHSQTEELDNHYHCDEPRSSMSPEPHDTHDSPLTTSSMTSPSIPSRTIHRKQCSYDLRDDYLQTALPATRNRHATDSSRRFTDSNHNETHHANPPGRSSSWPEGMRLYKSTIITHSMTS
ncbi:hypothetical protein CVT25_000767 [Psilocybe cyanescens]|uniref:Uncharacterized protein n=1 Tax=Psilocybe cyanescens TaxID=93625 RepID=A0A409XMB6_PSICY|nr:hypothetical protein CVT25_000767 [Psilocybe cyanescens]